MSTHFRRSLHGLRGILMKPFGVTIGMGAAVSPRIWGGSPKGWGNNVKDRGAETNCVTFHYVDTCRHVCFCSKTRYGACPFGRMPMRCLKGRVFERTGSFISTAWRHWQEKSGRQLLPKERRFSSKDEGDLLLLSTTPGVLCHATSRQLYYKCQAFVWNEADNSYIYNAVSAQTTRQTRKASHVLSKKLCFLTACCCARRWPSRLVHTCGNAYLL